MKILIVLLIILLIFVICFLVGNYFLNFLVKPKVGSLKLYEKVAKKEGSLKHHDLVRDFELKMKDGYLIHAHYLPNNSNKFVIISHGITANSFNSYKYANVFFDNGYNVIFYDSRGHGANEEHLITLGHYEAKDLKEIIDYVRNKYQPDILGLHGESMGAIVSLLVLKYDTSLDFVVSDSAFADSYKHIKYHLKHEYKVPEFMLYLGDFACYLRYHFRLKEIRPIAYLDNDVKKLFIHSKKDDFILVENSIQLDNVAKNSELVLFDESKHALNINRYPLEYHQLITRFLNDVEKGK